MRPCVALLMITLLLAAGGCGQKGVLYLPDRAAKPAPAPATTPAKDDAERDAHKRKP